MEGAESERRASGERAESRAEIAESVGSAESVESERSASGEQSCTRSLSCTGHAGRSCSRVLVSAGLRGVAREGAWRFFSGVSFQQQRRDCDWLCQSRAACNSADLLGRRTGQACCMLGIYSAYHSFSRLSKTQFLQGKKKKSGVCFGVCFWGLKPLQKGEVFLHQRQAGALSDKSPREKSLIGTGTPQRLVGLQADLSRLVLEKVV